MIAPDMPGATPAAQPGPDTPVPSWAQQSYKAYLQMKAKVHGGTRYTRKTYWQMPDWSGVWNHVDGYAWDHNVDQNAKRDTEPFIKKIFEHCSSFPCEGWVTATLTPKYALRYREKLAAGVHGVQWDPLSQCLPGGFPRDILVTAAAYKFLPTPNETIMYWQEDQGDRVIHTDGRGHIPEDEAFPLWVGNSIGFWDGDTLVAHTLYMRSLELNRNLPGDSDEASVVERIRLADPNTMEDAATLYDPLALRTPWYGVQKYVRVTDRHIRADLFSCEENQNVVQTGNGSSTFVLPGETILIKRRYVDPQHVQEADEDRVFAYGAKVLKMEGAKASNGKQP